MKRTAVIASIAVSVVVVLYVADEYWPTAFASPTAKADAILVEKSARRLTLFSDGVATRTYNVALGGEPIGHKQR